MPRRKEKKPSKAEATEKLGEEKTATTSNPPTSSAPRKRGRPPGSKNKAKSGVKKGQARSSGAKGKAKEVQGSVKAILPMSPEQAVEQVLLTEINLEDKSFQFRLNLRVGPLAESIKEHGLQIPVILRAHPDAESEKKYQVISGFRRLTAIEQLGWDKVSAIIREDLEDAREAFKVSLIENEARKTYNDLDRGYAIVKYRELGYDFAELESVFSLGKRQLSRLQSLTTFPESLQEAIADVGLSTTHALVLQSARAKFPELDLEDWIERVLEEGLSVGKLKQLIQEEQKEEQGVSLFETQELVDEQGNDAGVQFLVRRRIVNPNEMDEGEKKQLKIQLQVLLDALL